MGKMKELLKHITDKGVKIALDDFGTGYSSLNCIKEMPLNTIKIDKSFIDDIAKNPDTAVFVKMIVNLSHDLHIAVCAEGVEEQVQFDILRIWKLTLYKAIISADLCRQTSLRRSSLARNSSQ